MEKIKIGEQEYTPEELKEAIEKSADYTGKTQKLADEARALEAEKNRLQSLAQVDDFLQKNPDTRQRVNQIISEDLKTKYGYDVPVQGTQPQQQPQPGPKKRVNKPQAQQPQQDFGYSPDYTPTAQNYSDDFDDDEPEYVTKKDMEKLMHERLNQTKQELSMQQQRQQLDAEMQRQHDQLKKMGYVDAEVQKVLQTAQQRGMWPLDAAQNLAFNRTIPDRFHEPPPKKDEGSGIKIMQGQAGSGYELPEVEKELIEHDNDPGELLRAKYLNKLIKED